MEDLDFFLLAGGQSERFKRHDTTIDKALIKHPKWGDIPLIVHLIKSLNDKIPNLNIIVNDEKRKLKYQDILDKFEIFNVEFLIDSSELSIKGPLNSLMTAFNNSKSEFSFFFPCDMPYIDSRLIQRLYDNREMGDIISYIYPSGKIEPLFSLYNNYQMRKIINHVDLFKKDRPSALFRGTNQLYFVSIKEIINIDPDLRSFININEPNSLEISSIFIPNSIKEFNSFQIINKKFVKTEFSKMINVFESQIRMFDEVGMNHLFTETDFSYYWIASYYDHVATKHFKKNPLKQKKFLELARDLYLNEKDYFDEFGLKFLSRHVQLDIERCELLLKSIQDYSQ
ncbi:MAG: molybdenum cofactor guanylyltransferase [Candidatus Lokiarchaeota archaeon]|nr:molybdenum cofactor guanylyltransferase [Candidatus Lokiarchaeota archaeon]